MSILETIQAVDHFFFGYQVAPELPALLRIATCLVLLFHFTTTFHDTWQFIKPNGLFPFPAFTSASRHFPQFTLINLFPASTFWAALIFAAFYLSGILALLGCFTSCSLWIFLVCTASLQGRAFVIVFSGGDSVSRVLLLFLALADCSATWSVDSLFQDFRTDEVAGWPIRAIQVYVCIVYFQSAVHKSQSAQWQAGDVIESVLLSPTWRRYSHCWLLRFPLILKTATRATVVFEFLFPLVFFSEGLQTFWLFGAVALHAAIWWSMRIGYFSPMMIVAVSSFGGELLSRLQFR